MNDSSALKRSPAQDRRGGSSLRAILPVSIVALLASPAAAAETSAEPPPAPVAAAPEARPLLRGDGWSIGAYGEVLASTRFFHPDPKKTSSYRQTDIDLARLSFFVDASIADWISFSSEIEIEHGGTGATKEIEWEEFGEYETEVEKGGEVQIEQAYLEARLSRNVALRAGHLIVPVGMTSVYHLPDMFSSTRRPEAEAHLIPLVWHETGAEVAVRGGSFGLRLQVMTGLDSSGFSSQEWIAGGTQQVFEKALLNDVGVALSVEYTGIPGTLIGAAGYTSNTTHNRPKRELDDLDARIFLGDVILRGQYGPLRVRGLAMLGTLGNADEITTANARLSNNLGVPRTPVGRAAYAFFAEAAFDVLSPLGVSTRQRLDVFVRYDAYDSMWKPPAELDNPLLQRRVLTAGFNYFPHPRVVLKAEYLSRWINQNSSWDLRQDEVNAAMGFLL